MWQVDGDILEEHVHPSAAEVLLAAYCQRTKGTRLGQGIVQTPLHDQPERVAERIATRR